MDVLIWSFPESSPECSSNVSKDGAVGENTCNIEPDVVEMTCSVKYRGNSSPSLAWRDEGTKSVIQSGVSSTSEPTRSNITLVMKASSTLNQHTFYCVVVNKPKQYLSGNYSCSGPKMKVMCKSLYPHEVCMAFQIHLKLLI